MRVFAKYFTKEGFEYRKNTLLQFGTIDDPDSWKLIGSLFLINPGSAEPINKNMCIDGYELNKILKFLPNEKKCNDWFEFKDDPTMRWIESLFSGKYINKSKPLKGIIQLFNLFNLRDPDLENAIVKMAENKENVQMFSYREDLELIEDKPVYLGWGLKGKSDEILREFSENIFNKIKSESANQYLKDKFEDNSFYHPRFINMSYKKPPVQALLHNFSENKLKYTANDFGNYTNSISNMTFKSALSNLVDEINNDIEQLFAKYDLDSYKIIKENSIVTKTEIRLGFKSSLGEDLEITIASKEKSGYLGVRALTKGSNKDWNSGLKYKTNYISALDDMNFQPYKSIWLGKKMTSEMGYETQENTDFADLIKKEIMNNVIMVISELNMYEI